MAYTKLEQSTATFSDMLGRFGVVTVMNADVYKNLVDTEVKSPEEYLAAATSDKHLCRLDTLKIANVTVEGPSKTVTGGQYSNPLIKFGKSARLEMQDALGNAKVIDALCGGVAEYEDSTKETLRGLHYGEDFGAPVTIIGDSFFIDQKTGAQVPVKIIFYQFLPDSIFNLTQDAEGDATVFDMNGDLLTTTVNLPSSSGATIKHGIFYSIVSPEENTYVKVTKSGDNYIVAAGSTSGATITIDGVTLSESNKTIAKGTAAHVVAKVKDKVVFDQVISA